MKNEKYNMFRNYMMNDLGIGKEDIRAWVQETIEEQIEHKLRTLNLERVVAEQLIKHMNNSGACKYHGGDPLASLKHDIAGMIAGKINLELKTTEEINAKDSRS